MSHILLVVESHARKLILQKRVRAMYRRDYPNAQSLDDLPMWVTTVDGSLMGRTFEMIVVMFDWRITAGDLEMPPMREFMQDYLPTKLVPGGMLIHGHEHPYSACDMWHMEKMQKEGKVI